MLENEKLAILGGPKAVSTPFKKFNSIGNDEINAVTEVLKSGNLSSFLGAWDPKFYGGKKVLEFEESCKNFFGVKHAVTVNSWTSGLIAALGAINIQPGDEVIVTPWTMCATATAILHWNAIPVFADIESITFNIDPSSIEKNITPYTKAIVAVDIFGHPCDIQSIMKIAKKYNLKVVTDSAQSPGSNYMNGVTGTFGDIGGFSLNYHKHIHTGEGGILVTNDDEMADRLRLIRNHGEAVVGPMGIKNLSNMIGYNFRLGEIECAIGIEQLKKLNSIVERRRQVALKLIDGLSHLKGLRLPITLEGCSHSYYMFPMIINPEFVSINRDALVSALQAEGIEGLGGGYVNVHMLPMYQEKIAYGNSGFPWSSELCKRDVSYAKGICPNAEELHDSTYLGFSICLFELDDGDIEGIVKGFTKVWDNLADIARI